MMSHFGNNGFRSSLSSMLSISVFGQRSPLFIRRGVQADSGRVAFPGHALGLGQHDFDISEAGSIPVLFQKKRYKTCRGMSVASLGLLDNRVMQSMRR